MPGRTILNQDYPPPNNSTKNVAIALGFGLFIAAFLIFFEPFDINIRNYSTGELSIFGLITTLCFLFFQNLFPALFPKFFEADSWKVKHQMLYYGGMVFFISTLNGVYINYLRDLSFSWSNYGEIIWQTFGLGVIGISLIVLLDYNWKLRKNLQQAERLSLGLLKDTPSPNGNTFTIQTDLKESFTLHEEDFLFAQSDGNYIHIHRKNAPKTLHRLSLHALAQQLESKALMRCHRSYLVNLNQVQRLKGNAQGLKLFFDDKEPPVPVSRKYLAEVKQFMENSRNLP